MLYSCSYCGKIHDDADTHRICPSKPPKDYSNYKRDKQIDKFRWTKEWRAKREMIGHRDMFCCQICARGLYNTINRQYNYDDISCHHIEPLNERYDLRLDDGNLLDCCSMHHRMCETGEISKDVQHAIAQEQNKKWEDRLKENI